MSDAASLRAELKAWEKQFKTDNGREPSVQDIKAHPTIADRYKLYKKLSKFATAATSSSAQSTSAHPPVTPTQPTRTKSRLNGQSSIGASTLQVQATSSQSTTLPPKARAVHTIGSPTAFNPFSPVKNKTKQRSGSTIRALGDFNPFLNPINSPSKSRRPPTSPPSSRGVSPDPFSDAPGPPSSTSSAKLFFPPSLPVVMDPIPAADPAIVRARKRLAGEPVSPSPKKEKRQRVMSGRKGPLQTKLAFPKIGAPSLFNSSRSQSAPTDDDDMHDDVVIEDSPFKAPSGDSFKSLFDEPLAAPVFGGGAAPVLTDPESVNTDFDDLSDVDMDAGDPRELARTASGKPLARVLSGKPAEKTRKAKNTLPGARVPGKDNLFAGGLLLPEEPPQPRRGRKASSKDVLAASQPFQKRSISQSTSGAEPDEEVTSTTASGSMSTSTSATLVTSQALLPPSPPPADAKARPRYKTAAKSKPSDSRKGKGKAKAKAQDTLDARKKRRMSSDAETPPDSAEDPTAGDDSSDEHAGVRVLDWGSSQRALFGPGNDNDDHGALSDFDPEFDFSLSRRARQVAVPAGVEDEDQGSVQVDLPDHLHQLLAFSPAGLDAAGGAQRGIRTKERDEHRLARAIISGARHGHYDASRGGEVWDAGDFGEDGEREEGRESGSRRKEGAVTDEDDDWEGEGVPWEVGEL